MKAGTQENVTCETCRAVYLATRKYEHGPGEHYCQICGNVALRWDGKRSYSDFHLVYRPEGWKPWMP